MNQTQKQQITLMRNQGFGYSKISSVLGLSANTVKSFCQRSGLGGARKSTGAEVHFCAQCGEVLVNIPHTKPKKFCSGKCRSAWWNAHPERAKGKTQNISCVQCGASFFCYGTQRKYCSHECYIKARFGGKDS